MPSITLADVTVRDRRNACIMDSKTAIGQLGFLSLFLSREEFIVLGVTAIN